MREVRVLAGIHSAGLKPNLPLLLIDLVDCSHYPVTARDLILNLPVHAVIQIALTAAITFARPHDLLAVGDVVTISRPGFAKVPCQRAIRKERLGLLVNQRSCFAGCDVDFDDAISLMPALIVFKREGT